MTGQFILWWLFHIATLLWNVLFPFHARSFGKMKNIHIACVILGILLPLIPIITPMAAFAVDLQNQNENSTSEVRNSLFLSGGLGFGSVRFPPILCAATDQNIFFYSYIFIVDIIIVCGCTMLLIIVWSVHRRLQVAKKSKPYLIE